MLRAAQGLLLLPACLLFLVSAFTIRVAEGAGVVAFANGRSIDAISNDPFSVFAADVDGDGDLDVIAAFYYGNGVVWYDNLDGKGTFSEGVLISSSDRLRPRSVAVGDINGDGFPDVVAAFESSDLVTWYRNTDGLGGFSVGVDIATDAQGAAWVALADIDGDGDLDVVSASYADDRATWYENTDGDGTFSVGLDLTTTADEANMLVANDIDGDGDIDVVLASFYDDRVMWFENSDGEGSFSLGVDLAEDANGARYVATADLDGDEDLDVVSASYYDGRIVWYENTDGGGTFAAGEDVDILETAETVVAVDLDNDGDMDLVACDPDGGRVVWYENTDGGASFSAAIDIALDIGVREVIAVDLDGDGDLDLLSASRTQDRVVWYENLLIEADEEETTEVTPSPLPVTAPTPSPSAESSTTPPVGSSPAPTPVTRSPPTDPGATPAPIPPPLGDVPTSPEATASPVAAPIGTDAVSPVSSDGGGNSHTTEIVVGVVTTVVGGTILAIIVKFCLKGS